MDMSSEFLVMILSVTLVGISKAGFGTGVGIVAVPLMASVLPPREMLGMLLPILILGDILSLVHYPGQQDGRNLAILIPGCLLGVVLGASVLSRSLNMENGEGYLRMGIGLICVIFVLIELLRTIRSGRRNALSPYHPRIWHGIVLGTVAGFTSTLAHASGPLIGMFLLPQRLDKRKFVGTCLVYFLVGNGLKLVPYIFQKIVTPGVLIRIGWLIPFLLLGTLLGSWLNRSISAKWFTRTIHLVVLVTGLKLIIQS